MTDHEMLLLRAAVEVTEDVRVQYADGEWHASTRRPPSTGSASILADALTALLRDLGAEVPEWPSEELVAMWRKASALGQADPTALPLPEYLALRGAP